jgi:transposase
VTRARCGLALELVEDLRRIDAARKDSQRRVEAAVAASATSLTKLFGIGPACAAILLTQSGDNGRFPSKDHYAADNGTAPIEASSGARRRHRLSRRGNRQLNHALHVMAVVQISHPGPGADYHHRKLAEGKSTKEALRALKRRLSDVVYRQLVIDACTARDRARSGRTPRDNSKPAWPADTLNTGSSAKSLPDPNHHARHRPATTGPGGDPARPDTRETSP